MQSLVTFPSPVPDREAMAHRNDQKEFIRDEIKQQLTLAIDAFKPHGWVKAAFFLRQLGPIATSIAVFVAVLGIAAGAIYQATARVGKEATFETNTDRDLKEIRDDIKAIRGELAKQGLFNHASLPLSDFRASLPALSSAIATAKQQNVKVAPKVIGDLQQKIIAAGEGTPGFWPTAGEFISYRSQITATDFQGLLRLDLPNCVDSDPTPQRVIEGSIEVPPMKVAPYYYDNCRFTLDSAQDDAKINSLLKNGTVVVAFRHCLIVYRGGQIDLRIVFSGRPSVISAPGQNPVPVPVTLKALRFENCLFNFIMPSAPALQGQELTKRLLAESGSEIEFAILKSLTHS